MSFTCFPSQPISRTWRGCWLGGRKATPAPKRSGYRLQDTRCMPPLSASSHPHPHPARCAAACWSSSRLCLLQPPFHRRLSRFMHMIKLRSGGGRGGDITDGAWAVTSCASVEGAQERPGFGRTGAVTALRGAAWFAGVVQVCAGQGICGSGPVLHTARRRFWNFSRLGAVRLCWGCPGCSYGGH